MDAIFLEFLSNHTAGSPTDESIKWTHLHPKQIAKKLKQDYGINLGKKTVRRLLRKHGFRRRKMQKSIATGSYERRDEQFKIIFYLIGLMNHTDGAIISIDTKKKEQLGNLYRAGKCYCTQAIKVFDHDYPHLAQGKIIPHGIYDLKANKGYISIGTSAETAAFIADNILWWWDNFGIHQYGACKQILILCDAGGANGWRKHSFKKEMQRIAELMGIRIIISHYPPYCSKWNPIEHRLFAHVHRAINGVVFSSYELVKELIGKTSTSKGLTVEVRIVKQQYLTGLRCPRENIEINRIRTHQDLPDLNYTILP